MQASWSVHLQVKVAMMSLGDMILLDKWSSRNSETKALLQCTLDIKDEGGH